MPFWANATLTTGKGLANFGSQGEYMFKHTISFDRKNDAELFDQHILDFLKYCEEQNQKEEACLFSTSQQEQGRYIRVVKTDSARMLGRLSNFLTVKNVSPSFLFAPNEGGVGS